MKEIKAIIQPFMLTKVIEALQAIEGLPGVAISDLKGFGKKKTEGVQNNVIKDMIEYVRKVKLEIVVSDAMVEKVVSVIQENAFTGKAGDGKIFIHTVDDVVKIRTNERGEGAI